MVVVVDILVDAVVAVAMVVVVLLSFLFLLLLLLSWSLLYQFRLLLRMPSGVYCVVCLQCC